MLLLFTFRIKEILEKMENDIFFFLLKDLYGVEAEEICQVLMKYGELCFEDLYQEVKKPFDVLRTSLIMLIKNGLILKMHLY